MKTINTFVVSLLKSLITIVIASSFLTFGQSQAQVSQQTNISEEEFVNPTPSAIPLLSQEEALNANNEAIKAFSDYKKKERNKVFRFLIIVIPLSIWLILLASTAKAMKKNKKATPL